MADRIYTAGDPHASRDGRGMFIAARGRHVEMSLDDFDAICAMRWAEMGRAGRALAMRAAAEMNGKEPDPKTLVEYLNVLEDEESEMREEG